MLLMQNTQKNEFLKKWINALIQTRIFYAQNNAKNKQFMIKDKLFI